MAKILIAEDEPDIQMLVKLTVEHAGHTCRAADDGQAAVEAAQAEKPDLIILDVNMPRLDGYAACRKIRADEKLAQVPVLFLSVRGAPKEVTAGFEAGATEYLVKPFAPDQLLKVVGEILARKAAPLAAAPATTGPKAEVKPPASAGQPPMQLPAPAPAALQLPPPVPAGKAAPPAAETPAAESPASKRPAPKRPAPKRPAPKRPAPKRPARKSTRPGS